MTEAGRKCNNHKKTQMKRNKRKAI